MATISKETQDKLAKQMDDACSDPNKIPGTVFASVNKKGETVFAHAAGKRGVESDEPMTLDTVFWIASCTKMITALSCMQLVEAGRLNLDDADQIEQLCPYLKKVKILKGIGKDGKPELVEKKNRITLRMLLTHTAGFGYSFFNREIKRSNGSQGWDEFSGDEDDALTQPLVFEPGTNWQYGVNIDWAGRVLEASTGKKLNDYMQEYVFKPLGITEINMFPTPEMKERLAQMHQKYGDTMRNRDHLHRRPLSAKAQDQAALFNSGGAGAFAKPTEYCKILAALLNDGVSPTTGNRILKPESIKEVFANQIEKFPDFARTPIPDAKPELTNAIPELFPQPKDQPQGWNLLGMLTISPTEHGRGANTTWWAGLSNLFWHCDREKGVAGMIASQILPFGDPNVMGLWLGLEGGIYAGLGK